MCMTTAYLNRIATAVPEHDVHDTFVVFAEKMIADPRLRTAFRRMVSRADIAHRYSFLVAPGLRTAAGSFICKVRPASTP